ncbi:alpha/beta fold hydrolase [Myxococcus sp. RHSTA-1-4]|uniref:alpha/beta fold hydrolase n=1 Tax=Myxococcus sp. RHSTA-1-4 TaxID=2874601 RepID=UPI001CBFEC99|nr:alpha/beta hydrolase [Myxococcus sp. RHSTA-1-4]MBZ4418841.1 alpha/beta hydrolase [Myxococcus sp. RHSTA-1-4]
MKSAFRGEQAKAVLSRWHDHFRNRLKVPTESRTVKTRFGDTHVLVGGPESGPSVVVLHGALASSAHVLHELAPLMERFRVHAVDVVGQSVKSADVRPSVSNNEYGEWLRDVLDGLSLQRTHVVGVSWGGFVSIRLAAVAPERINRLALLFPAGVVNGSHWDGLTKVALPMMLYRLAPSERRLKAFVSNLLTTTDDDWTPFLGDAVRSCNMDMRVPALANPEELKGLKAPTLVLGGDGDVSFPGQKLLARARELFPTLADQELIKDCLHCPPTTDAFRHWLGERLSGFLLEQPGVSQRAATA